MHRRALAGNAPTVRRVCSEITTEPPLVIKLYVPEGEVVGLPLGVAPIAMMYETHVRDR